jgi:DNA segregation ATPase FtsK/SpoIIIE-like protein
MNFRTGVSMGRYLAARDLLRERGEISPGMIQNFCKVGYTTAVDIMEVLEQDGEIGPATGNQPRPALKPAPALDKKQTGGPRPGKARF